MLIVGPALADQPDRCLGRVIGQEFIARPVFTTPGEFNKYVKERAGTPGQNEKLPANEFAQLRNDEREKACPPPGQQAPVTR